MSGFWNNSIVPFLPVDASWPLPNFSKSHKLWSISSAFVIPVVGVCSKIIARWLNTSVVHNREILVKALDERSPQKPLITVSNHYSCVDDPLLWGSLNVRHYRATRMRWSLGANDICFTNELHALFFSLGKTIPIVRGNGVYQKAMDFVLERLNHGDWVHIFPEGKVNMTKEFIRYKWGVGRLVTESSQCPTVLPIFHIGMDEVLPNTPPYVPQIGKKVTVCVGNPLDFEETLADLKSRNKRAAYRRKIITARIQEEMEKLQEICQSLHHSS